jgi:hypothetical protein
LVVVNAKQGTIVNLKYLLALLNSKLMNYLYKRKSKSTKTVFSEIQARTVRQLPIVSVEPSVEASVLALVERILKAKGSEADADTAVLEGKIDRLVYELYGLTEEEVSLVEASST